MVEAVGSSDDQRHCKRLSTWPLRPYERQCCTTKQTHDMAHVFAWAMSTADQAEEPWPRRARASEEERER